MESSYMNHKDGTHPITGDEGASRTTEAAETSGDTRLLPPAARRALAEAAERRQRAADAASRPREVNGREGPGPVRYGDWEKNGIASDF